MCSAYLGIVYWEKKKCAHQTVQKVQGAYVGSTVPAQGRRGKAQDNTKKKKRKKKKKE